MYELILSSTGCPLCWNCMNISRLPGRPGSQAWKYQNQSLTIHKPFPKETSMSDQKRPQLAPEVLDPPSTQSTGSKAGTDKDLPSLAADATVLSTEKVHEPKMMAVALPIVEMSPSASISSMDV